MNGGGVEPTLTPENTPHVALTADDNAVHYVKKLKPKPEFPKFVKFEFNDSNDGLSFATGYNFEYSFDNVTWNIWNTTEETTKYFNSDIVYLRGKNTNGFYGNTLNYIGGQYNQWKISGNLNALIDYENCDETLVLPENAFKNFLKGSLTKAYGNEIDLILPSLVLSPHCYENLLSDNMIGGGETWKIICLATDISATDCTKDWLSNIFNMGTFVKSKGTDWPSGTNGIPEGWTVEEFE